MSTDCGKSFRLGRIFNQASNKAVCVAFDHGLDVGPMPGITDARGTMAKLVEGGADAVLVSPGVARICKDQFTGKQAPALILRMDWTNIWRPIPQLSYAEGSTCLIAQVEDAVRYGADAVLSFMFIGYADSRVEADEIAKNAALTRACERFGIPHIIEPMCRGSKAADKAFDAEFIAFACRMAVEIGADALKTDYSGSAASYRPVIEACPVPILIAGGPKTKTLAESFEMVEGAVEAGAAGVLLGRNIIQAEDPAATLRTIRAIVHDGMASGEAMRRFLG
ncbi:class I fructose-bisphosphate aldolase [Mesorhizobium sp. INR15]|uniref:class I fructose-bisphosphate aldolase n=1 Tax=Mesorhizobium sp. INR15 TaxID=2654248 RepID=UPI0018968C2A|nr:hypothetical protein [Mesorhizobium sp. INR15]QPC94580.1 hypothetical protein GA829_30475 [Mesorhizobium sp. INR15]